MQKVIILWKAKPYLKRAGIYFLILNEEIVYIWSTLNFDYRIQEHVKEKIFDSYSFFEIWKELILREKSLLEYENELIMKFSPKYNKIITKAPWFLNKSDLKKFWLNFWFIKKHKEKIRVQTYNWISFYNEKDILFIKNSKND